MSKQQSVFEMNGKTYYSPKAASERWNISYRVVLKALQDGRIVGAFQDSTHHWCIPENAMKPIDKEIIRKILIITLSLKNTPNNTISGLENYDISKLYAYLRDIGYIKPFDEGSNRIPYEAILTEKGMDLVINNKKMDIAWTDLAATFISCIPSILEISSRIIN